MHNNIIITTNVHPIDQKKKNYTKTQKKRIFFLLEHNKILCK